MSLDNMEERVEKLEGRVGELKETVEGNRQEPGIIHSVRQVVRDMYDQTQGFGVTHRVQNLEQEKSKYENRFQGASWLLKIEWVLIGGILTAALMKLLKL